MKIILFILLCTLISIPLTAIPDGGIAVIGYMQGTISIMMVAIPLQSHFC